MKEYTKFYEDGYFVPYWRYKGELIWNNFVKEQKIIKFQFMADTDTFLRLERQLSQIEENKNV